MEEPVTSVEWEKSEGAEKYMRGSGAYMEIDAVCENGLLIEEYARQLLEFLEQFYTLDVYTEIYVSAGPTTIFFAK